MFTTTINNSSPILIALDYSNLNEMLDFVDKIDPQYCRLKIGKEVFTRFGPSLIKNLQKKGFQIFLDLKFHDIPNTVARAVTAAAELGIWMVNIHAIGGINMMISASKAIMKFGKDAPLLTAVTILTSISQNDLKFIGIQLSLDQYVKKLAVLAQECGLNGIICSANQVKSLKKDLGKNFKIVVPGIRLSGDQKNDHCYVTTPLEAKNIGVDYMVIGRSITNSKNPFDVLQKILFELNIIKEL
ncbi:orotidine-5'-phosphate decarboxylase [Candidatus Tachikawaea gelatinosa]|uniref:Orotidine 5'-phosphate decarboxylase n=1 Tax=Candidatus Tachikawaea gelatinosa TaxID=1410383 RepID=A0A090AM75_9ENTR|nr:orotidine-5'-phosphate decarboxylase [Candidatus Tachikawaea gelatinosa]BAP58759.1 orotidine 5'-phosphate decarboxylase [Candidatus Tachikawaea gelatinosa]